MDQRQEDERFGGTRRPGQHSADDGTLGERRHLFQGFGRGLTEAFEITLIPLLLGVLGHLVDRWLGTVVVFAILLALFGLVGVGVKLWYGYDFRMRQHEAEGAWIGVRRAP